MLQWGQGAPCGHCELCKIGLIYYVSSATINSTTTTTSGGMATIYRRRIYCNCMVSHLHASLRVSQEDHFCLDISSHGCSLVEKGAVIHGEHLLAS